ncbi:response regulator transcription factor [Paenibacillus sp. GCM10023252]|uniref:response regulator transcription factor n=1 Tax=Paenibacillus sp. GCM10023252 TaxID=3252649 RepID=UPI00361D7F62
MAAGRGARLLIVDDEPAIIQFLELGLTHEGYEVKTASDGLEAIDISSNYNPHVVILDVMMPELDGFEVCRRLKESIDNVAIIMLTARGEVTDRVAGLTLGADDYLVKPFSFDELVARIGARLRNQFPSLLGEVNAGPFRVDDQRKEILYRNEALALSPTEYELLKCMILHHGIVLSKTMILDKVWGYHFGGEDNIVEVYVRSLRDKLGDKEHRLIRTLRGAGYRMDLP